MSAEKVWNIGQEVVDKYQDELRSLYSRIGQEIDRKLAEKGLPLRHTENGETGYTDSKERLLALDKVCGSLGNLYLYISWWSTWDAVAEYAESDSKPS